MLKLTLSLLASLLLASPAMAATLGYTLGPGSSLTLEGQATRSLSGDLTLAFKGFCIGGVSPANCQQSYDVTQLSLTAEGFEVDFSSPLPPIGGVVFLTPRLFGSFPGPLTLQELSVARGFGFDPFPGGFLLVDTALRSAAGAVTPDAEFGDGVFPDAFTLDLELVEVARQFVTGNEFPVSTERTVIGTLRIEARAVAAIPEPGAAALHLLGLGVIARTIRRR